MNGVAVVTGGGRGIGKAVALELSRRGWRVAIAGRTQASLDGTASEMTGEALGVATDVSIESDVNALFEATTSAFGRVDLLFNNAGIAAPAVPIDELDVEQWKRLIDINVTGTFLCARGAFGHMRNQDPQGGRIINNGSVSAHTPRPFSAPYTTSKHAVTGLTKSLALDGRAYGISCGQIDIGNVSSDMGDKMAEGVLQPNGTTMGEPTMHMANVVNAVMTMVEMPAEANVLSLTVMATNMPLVGRG